MAIYSYIKLYDPVNLLMKTFTQPDGTGITVKEKLNDISTFEATITNNQNNRYILSNYKNSNFLICYRRYVDDTLSPILSDDTEKITRGNSYVKVNTITVTDDLKGLLTLKFDVHKDSSSNMSIKILKNNSILYDYTEQAINNISISNINSTVNYRTYEIRISNQVTYNDKFELYVKTDTLSGKAYSKNFRLFREYLIFTGIIDGENDIEYSHSDRNLKIKISGYYKPYELSHGFFKTLSNPVDQSGNNFRTWIYSSSTGIYTNRTTEANNSVINDIQVPVSNIGDAIYFGYINPIGLLRIKYSTPGVYDASPIWEYWNGSIWVTLNCSDDSDGFRRDAAMRFITVSNVPTDWAKTTVSDAIQLYYMRMRLTTSESPPATDISCGIKGYWSFDEGQGSIINDSSGNANTGSLGDSPNNPTWVSGKYGNALNFDGTKFAKVSHSQSLILTTAFSITTWINKSADVDQGRIISKGKYPNNDYAIISTSDGKIYAKIKINGTNYTSPMSSVLSLSTDYYIEARYDSSVSKLRLFIGNGTTITEQGVGTTVSGTIDNGGEDLYFGQDLNGGYGFKGKIDEPRVYSTALTDSQSTNIMKGVV